MVSLPIAMCTEKAAIVSLHFSPAHASHMMAYGKLLRVLGLTVTFVLDEKYLSFIDFSAVGPAVSVRDYAKAPDSLQIDIAIFYNAAVHNARVASHMRALGISVLYVFHEPVPLLQRLSESWKSFLKLVAAKYCSLAMLRQSTAVLVPSACARRQYDRYFCKYNPMVFTLPLLFDDEYGADSRPPMHELRRHFSFLGNVHKAHDFDAFVRFVKYAIRAQSAIQFTIATKTSLTAFLNRDEELARYLKEGKLRIQHGKVLSNDEMNQYYRESFCVWNAYNCSTQSGVLPRAFMAGTPVIAKRMGSFPEYIVPGVNGEFITAANDCGAILQAAEKIRQDIPTYVEGARKTFMRTFYYEANLDQLARILASVGKEKLKCA